ncbi:MAG: hypothetical protein C0404_12005 [Verrucomicrobia bacterium]|nr:hypothetical protein [Verrucomicrobiota bacterium]
MGSVMACDGAMDTRAGWPKLSEMNRSEGNEIARLGPDGECSLRMAVSGEDRLKCWNLVHRIYVGKGYMQEQSLPYRYTVHDALPATGTFFVECDGAMVGTVTVFLDSPVGLPADEAYRPELNKLRVARRQLAEIGRLVIDPAFGDYRRLLMQMVQIPCLFARRVLGASDVVITVNPKHESFYERMMLFQTIGHQKDMSSVGGAPAVLLRMDLAVQEAVIRWAKGEGALPEGLNPRHTIYRSFATREEESEMAARIRVSRGRLDGEFFREYFVTRRQLLPGLPSELQHFFDKWYPWWNLGANPSLAAAEDTIEGRQEAGAGIRAEMTAAAI